MGNVYNLAAPRKLRGCNAPIGLCPNASVVKNPPAMQET